MLTRKRTPSTISSPDSGLQFKAVLQVSFFQDGPGGGGIGTDKSTRAQFDTSEVPLHSKNDEKLSKTLG